MKTVNDLLAHFKTIENNERIVFQDGLDVSEIHNIDGKAVLVHNSTTYMKAQEFIESLSKFEGSTVVCYEQDPIIHFSAFEDGMVVSSELPVGICNRSGGTVYPTVVPDYDGYCVAMDEDLYLFEFTPIQEELSKAS